MAGSKVKTRGVARREAKTERGQNVIETVIKTARQLLQSHFHDQVSIVELAETAKLQRASLLLQFPGGWPDILNTLAVQEHDFFDAAFERVVAEKGKSRPQRLFTLLDSLLIRGEATGLLYPNLRGAMFTWGQENQGVFHCGLDEMVGMTMELLAGPNIEPELRLKRAGCLAESLVNLAWDLASSEGLWLRTWQGRRDALRFAIEAAVAAVKPGKPARKRR